MVAELIFEHPKMDPVKDQVNGRLGMARELSVLMIKKTLLSFS